jgi:YD repeat-containing protein
MRGLTPLSCLNRQLADLTYNINGQSFETRTPMPTASGGWSTTTHTYTDRGELWKAIDAFGFTEFTNDENANLRYLRNRLNNTWEFTYNDDNQLEDTISPNPAHRMEKRYDARGLLHTVTEPSGQLTTYTPDALGRVNVLDDPLGRITYTYDNEGRADTVQENTAGAPLIDRDYDPLGRLTRYQRGADYALEWIYHDPENAFSLKYPDGTLVRYGFDNRGR